MIQKKWTPQITKNHPRRAAFFRINKPWARIASITVSLWRAREIWTGLLSKLNEMSERFNVILLAHSHLKTVNDPMQSAAYDMHRIKIHDKSAEIIRQMVDLICFANLDVSIIKESQKARKGRGIISEDRLMWTAPTTGIEAKNRYDLDNPMPFSWAALEKGVNDFYDR